MHRGYIKLFRKIRESAIWSERRVFSRAEAWIDLLMEAHHDRDRPARAIISGRVYQFGYGEVLWSIRFMSARWSWSKDKVSRFLRWLENEDSIRTETGTGIMKITILNYEKYNARPYNGKDSGCVETRTQTGRPPDERKTVKNVRRQEGNNTKHGEHCVLPEWLDPETWEDFKAHRIAVKAAMTPQAQKLILSKLEMLKSRGYPPEQVLKQSIERGWKGVFELNAPSNGNHHKEAQASTMWTDQGLHNLKVAEAYIRRMGPTCRTE